VQDGKHDVDAGAADGGSGLDGLQRFGRSFLEDVSG
jgi:hypothetical protein